LEAFDERKIHETRIQFTCAAESSDTSCPWTPIFQTPPSVIARELIINLTTGPGGRFVPDADKPRLAAGGAHLAWPAARDLIFSTFSQHHGPSHEPA
jgi:hypothetical protein